MASVSGNSCQESEFEESTGSDDFTQPLLGRRDYQRRCCKGYKIRRLKSNAAVLVLIWNLLVFSYQFESLRSILKLFPSRTLGDPWLAVFLTMVFQDSLPRFLYPIAGWLADTKYGRYRVIRASMRLMWGGSVVLLIALILQYVFTYLVVHSDYDVVRYFTTLVLVVVYVVNAIGLAGFHANIIPFGLDQMEDGSGEQYSAFIHWYYWTRNFSLGVMLHAALYSTQFVCNSQNEVVSGTYREPEDRIDLIILGGEVGFLTLAIGLDLLFSKWLIKEPKTLNPLKMVLKVSAFVVKHRQPVGHRSAFTYSSRPPSRSDLAKKPFGGPFETEDVEAVRTFWMIIAFLVALGGALVVNTAASNTYGLFATHTLPPDSDHLSSYRICTTQTLIALAVDPLVFAVLIPLYEFLIYPFFHSCILPILKRIGLGMIVSLIALLLLLILHAIAQSRNTYATCMFYSILPTLDQSLHLQLYLLAIPIVLMDLGEFLVAILAFEFICAQSPHAMRGLLIGIFYAVDGIFVGITGLILLFFAKSHLYTHMLSCGLLFYMVVLLIGTVGLVVYCVVAKWYRKRQRGGQEFVNERAILESYYERVIYHHTS